MIRFHPLNPLDPRSILKKDTTLYSDYYLHSLLCE